VTPSRTRALVLIGIVVLAAGAVVAASLARRDRTPCGPGFTRTGARCLVPRNETRNETRNVPINETSCPSPLVATEHGCDAPDRDVVLVPATTVVVGPSDWEAEGRVAPRTVTVAAFSIDRLEVTAGRACATPMFAGAAFCSGSDPARAAFGVTLSKARAYCLARGGRLPSEDEWLAAAGGDRPRRYPWGDTGAVCRRAAWGLEQGPCAEGADGPDTVGAHPEGATPSGIQDLAGNVAEWVEAVETGPNAAVVRGGSWRTRLATELRTWARAEVPAGREGREGRDDGKRGEVEDRGIGFRCAYDQVR
jgi:formylglycine-generating enzyme required for sulfatase activity